MWPTCSWLGIPISTTVYTTIRTRDPSGQPGEFGKAAPSLLYSGLFSLMRLAVHLQRKLVWTPLLGSLPSLQTTTWLLTPFRLWRNWRPYLTSFKRSFGPLKPSAWRSQIRSLRLCWPFAAHSAILSEDDSYVVIRKVKAKSSDCTRKVEPYASRWPSRSRT